MELTTFFSMHPRAALAFSGGTDSSFLLYSAKECGADIAAYYADTAFQPAFERADAVRMAEELHVRLRMVKTDILSCDVIKKNPEDRCYHCKKALFAALLKAAEKDGYSLLIDGSNASDCADDRPGMRALDEMNVLSPLRECGLTKEEIRRLSKEAGLFTWNKPAYACLATRIPAGEEITLAKLQRTEQAEEFLRSLGIPDLRVRQKEDQALIQVPGAFLETVLHHRKEILEYFNPLYSRVFLDLEERS